MTVDHWILLWKIVLIAGMTLFAVLAVAVSIGGAVDIRHLFQKLREPRDTE